MRTAPTSDTGGTNSPISPSNGLPFRIASELMSTDVMTATATVLTDDPLCGRSNGARPRTISAPISAATTTASNDERPSSAQ